MQIFEPFFAVEKIISGFILIYKGFAVCAFIGMSVFRSAALTA